MASVISNGPQSNPGEIYNWPMLRIIYKTGRDDIAASQQGRPTRRSRFFWNDNHSQVARRDRQNGPAPST